MCMSKPPKVKPVANAPTAAPEIIDDAAIRERDDLMRKRRRAYSRQNTILAGNTGSFASKFANAAAKITTGS